MFLVVTCFMIAMMMSRIYPWYSVKYIPKSSFCRFMSKKNDIRPNVDDVERISRGQAAKRRGTGSRSVPHRLNSEERIEWEFAKKRRYLNLRGTGWRKERGDSPLANIYRNYCDAIGIPCIRYILKLLYAVYGDNNLIYAVFSVE